MPLATSSLPRHGLASVSRSPIKPPSELAPLCRKDVVEDELFRPPRYLFAELSGPSLWTPPACPLRDRRRELGLSRPLEDYRPDLIR